MLDGLLYGALIGFGFAMTEDFFYYIGAFDEGGIGSLSAVIFLRAIVFGLNHGFYTGLTGIAFGLARNMNNPVARFIVPWIGLGLAILAHALHNFGVTIAEVNVAGLLLSLAMAGGSIALLIIVVILAWQYERTCVREELYDEIGTCFRQTSSARSVNAGAGRVCQHEIGYWRNLHYTNIVYANVAFTRSPNWYRRSMKSAQNWERSSV